MWKAIGCLSFVGIVVAAVMLVAGCLEVMDAASEMLRAMAEYYRK